MSTFLTVWQVGMVIGGVLMGIATLFCCIGWVIEGEDWEKKDTARIFLSIILGWALLAVWPVALPVLMGVGVRSLWGPAEFPKRLPRSERRRIAHELATKRADAELDRILHEEGLS